MDVVLYLSDFEVIERYPHENSTYMFEIFKLRVNLNNS